MKAPPILAARREAVREDLERERKWHTDLLATCNERIEHSASRANRLTAELDELDLALEALEAA